MEARRKQEPFEFSDHLLTFETLSSVTVLRQMVERNKQSACCQLGILQFAFICVFCGQRTAR